MEHQLVSVTETIEYGLRTPDGTVIWPPGTYKDFPIDTEAARSDMGNVLRVAASNLMLDPEGFVSGFGWVFRTVTATVVAKVSPTGLAIDALHLPTVDQPDPDTNE